MAGTFSRRNCGNTPRTHRHSQALAWKQFSTSTNGEMSQIIPKLLAFSMKQWTTAACSLRRFSVLAFIFSVPSPEWRRLGAKITDKLLLSILFSALLRFKTMHKNKNVNLFFVNNLEKKSFVIKLTSEKRCRENQKSDAGHLDFCRAIYRTAEGLQRFSPPLWGAAEPSGRLPAALWVSQALAVPWRTASPDRPHRMEEQSIGTLRRHQVLPTHTHKKDIVVSGWFLGSRFSDTKVNFSHHSPSVLSGEWQSLIFWTGPLCQHVQAASYMHQPESCEKTDVSKNWLQKEGIRKQLSN